VVWALSWLAIC
jgi:mRNA interferase YafQ